MHNVARGFLSAKVWSGEAKNGVQKDILKNMCIVWTTAARFLSLEDTSLVLLSFIPHQPTRVQRASYHK